MNKQTIENATRLYSLLIRFYPNSYVQLFRDEMVQTFKDHYRDVYETEGKVGIAFWFAVISDDVRGIGREQLYSVKNMQTMSLLLLMVFGLLISSSVMTIRISPTFMLVMLIIILFVTYFFFKKLSYPVRKSNKPIKHVWIKHGVLYGILLGLFLLPMNTVNMLTIQNILSLQAVPLGLLFLAGMPLLLIMSGYTAGQRSKEAKQGLFSGLLSAVIGSGVIVISTAVLLFVLWKFASTNATSVSTMIVNWRTFSEFHWNINLGANLVTTIIMILFGAILGGVGGLVGKKSARVQS